MDTSVREIVRNRSDSFEGHSIDTSGEPDLEQYYGSLKNYVSMVTGGYTDLLMLDAPGGLGKTYNICRALESWQSSGDSTESAPTGRDDSRKFIHKSGFTTPLELYKILYLARHENCILFLDDMSGITKKDKAVEMLKAATDTEGDENIIEYQSSRDIEHPTKSNKTLLNKFDFRGSLIMSFNDTPDNRHFEALKDRGIFHEMNFSYDERIEIIKELAKSGDFSPLSVEEQCEVAAWIESVTDPSVHVSIRTFEKVCQMRHFGQEESENWEKMALDVFDLDYEKYLVWTLRTETDMSVEEQIEIYEEVTGKCRSSYYNRKDELLNERE